MRRFIITLSLFLSLIFTTSLMASPLPPEKAFAFSASLNQTNQVLLKWQLAPGYYLYRDRLKIQSIPSQALRVSFPKGTWKVQDNSRIEVYFNQLTVPVYTKSSIEGLTISYQGCSDKGFCYPPTEVKLAIDVPAGTITSAEAHLASQKSLLDLVTDQEGVQTLLLDQPDWVVLLLFLGLGLLLAFTPCVLPMIPILTSIIVGQKSKSLQRNFLLSGTYVLGSAITYSFAGLLAAYMGRSIQVWLQTPVMIVFVSLLFVLLACSLFGLFDLQLPQRWQQKLLGLSNKQKGGHYLGVFLMGVLSTLIVSPCVTAPLVGVLLYVGQTGEMFFGAAALFFLGLGMGLPLILIGVSAGRFLPKSGAWMEIIKKTFGLLMLGMAIWMISRILPVSLTLILWQGLLLIGVFLIVFNLPFLNKRHFFKSYLFLSIVVGAVLIFGLGESNPINQWMHLEQAKSQDFKVVSDLAAVQQQLQLAQGKNKPVILDFYADWCDSCITMDKKVFNEPKIKNVLSRYVLLRADLSNNNAADEMLLKHFNVIAPPTVLFFDAEGQELNSQRIVGEVDAKEFLSRIGSQNS